ncbi:class I SAM-dependent methyltransferase [Snodgrassella sp. CFCC 13594]|uniref:class I SAM-dependent methyltransferase n=1 Tax=Snodgrassella sp. CFCC 13594 TaxID=1775559 RepID=UPI0009EEE88F|nr:class I SAM-dependent methyltransferase [Snodgrassella sp. CFCC 13594]
MRFPCKVANGLPEQQLAAWHHLCATVSLVPTSDLPTEGLHLQYDEQGLALAKKSAKGVVRVDFNGGAAQYRRLSGGGELLSRAVQPSKCTCVWDATAGLGRDTWVLANMGLTVCAFERHPVVYALLQDGLNRARLQADVVDVVQRIHLQWGSIGGATVCRPEPDVIYLDPMYPDTQKSAAAKKEMAYFHELVGLPEQTDDFALLNVARAKAKRRVVVKRPLRGAHLAGLPPAFQYCGKSVRFDVYLPIAKVGVDSRVVE